MADYKRMVSYMYQYENGVKRKNVGFAKVEAKNGQCKINLHMQLPGQLDSIFPTYLIQRSPNNLDLIYLGDTVLKNQMMDSKLIADETNIMGSGFAFSEMGGLLLFLNDNVFFATEWDDKPIVAKEVMEALRPKNNTPSFMEKSENAAGIFREDKTAQKQDKEDLTLEEELRIPSYKLPGGWKMIERLQNPGTKYSEMNKMDKPGLVLDNPKEKNLKVKNSYEKNLEGRNLGNSIVGDKSIKENSLKNNSVEVRAELRRIMEGKNEIGKNIVDRNTYVNSEKDRIMEDRIAEDKNSEDRTADGRIVEGTNLYQENLEPGQPEAGYWNQESLESENIEKDILDKASFKTDNIDMDSLTIEQLIREYEERGYQNGLNQSSNEKSSYQKSLNQSSNDVNSYQENLNQSSNDVSSYQENLNQRSNNARSYQESLNQSSNQASSYQDSLNLDSNKEVSEYRDNMENFSKEEASAQESTEAWQMGMDQPDHPTAKHFFENHPRIYPFEDNEIIQCVKIEPKDIGLFPKELWPYSNNSFLMHGFYCYHHLVFAKMKNGFGFSYVLGVPGIFHNREKFMARMFGFESFKSIKKRELKQGDFGYWYLPVNF